MSTTNVHLLQLKMCSIVETRELWKLVGEDKNNRKRKKITVSQNVAILPFHR